MRVRGCASFAADVPVIVVVVVELVWDMCGGPVLNMCRLANRIT